MKKIVRSKNGEIEFNDCISEESDRFINNDDLSKIGLVDIYFASKLSFLTMYNDFIDNLPSELRFDIKNYALIFQAFRKALGRTLSLLLKRSNLKTKYTKVSSNQIKVTYDLNQKLGSNTELIINEKSYSGLISDKHVIEIDGKKNIPNRGIVTLIGFIGENRHEIFKRRKHRMLFDDLLESKHNSNRFISAIENLKTEGIKAYSSTSLGYLTPQQTELAHNLTYASLTMVDSIAGTGKTTTLCKSIEEIVNNSERILVTAHSHKVVDSIIEMLENNSSKTRILRLATPNSKFKVTSGYQYLPENTLEQERKTILIHLNEQGDETTDDKLKKILQNLAKIVETNHFIKFLGLGKNIIFSTVDALLTDQLLVNYRQSIGNLQLQKPEFNLVIIEDSSDIDYPTLNFTLQYGQRWAIIGDHYQASPVPMNILRSQNYDDIQLPPKGERTFRKVQSLQEVEFKYYGIGKRANDYQRLISAKSFDILNDKEMFNMNNRIIKLNTWFRCTNDLAEFLQTIFMQLLGLVINGPPSKDLPLEYPLQIINTHSSGYSEKEISPGNYLNEYEIDVLFRWLESNSQEYSKYTIGIYSPYRSQIERMIERIQTIHHYSTSKIGIYYHKKYNFSIRFDTLHNHKNREYDIMVICGTRSQFVGQITNSDNLFTLCTRSQHKILLLIDYTKYMVNWKMKTKTKVKRDNVKNLPWYRILEHLDINPELLLEGYN